MINAYTGEVVDITWFRETDNGMNEHIGLASAGGADSEFSVGSVHGVTGLEGHDTGPSQLLEMGTELGGSVARCNIVIMVEAI